jgi:diguanylate cyclase (GGDEF)-like protein
MDDVNRYPVDRPSERRDLARKIVPFGAPAAVGYVVALLPSESPKHLGLLIAAGALLVAGTLAVAFAPWNRLPRRFGAVIPLGYIGVVALMRAGVDATNSTFAPLLLLPLVWLALYGTRAELILGLAGATTMLFVTSPANDAGLQYALVAFAVTPVLCFTIQRLVTKVRRQSAILEELAHADYLTGAANRSAWVSMAEREMKRAERTGEALTIGLINFDDFKSFNEKFGPEAGDDTLRDSVAAWRRELRGGDLLGRVDGDEFGIVLPACDADGALEVFDRLRIVTSDLQTCSIGIAEWKVGESMANFIARAEAALQVAKQAGGDRLIVAEPPVTPVAQSIEASLEDGQPLEAALAESRILIAELHAVAEAPDVHTISDIGDAGTRAEDEIATVVEVMTDEEDIIEELSSGQDDDNDEPAVTVDPESVAVTVEDVGGDDGIDTLLEAPRASEIHRLLRDLSSTR